MAMQRVLGMEWGHALLGLLCVLTVCVEMCDAVSVVDVYRMIQYDLQGVPFGSRRAALNHHASSLLLYSNANHSSDLSRSVIIVPIARASFSILNDLLRSKQVLGGLLLLLPSKFTSQGSADDAADSEDADVDVSFEEISELEQSLIHSSVPYPVYFAFENEKLKSLLREVEENDAVGRHATAITGGYKFVVPVAEPKKLATSSLTNLQAWLPGLRGDGDVSQLPTIAIVASYDTFGVAPGLSDGSDSNGSGTIALLELIRLFSRLYANPKTQGKYNLLFGLTSGGPFNYNGTAKWLKSFDQRLRESIDYAICLNSIGAKSNNLWLHVSKPPDSAYVKQIHDGLKRVADQIGLEVALKHKKINISNSRVAWEHEQFSRHRITAATLSKIENAPDLLEHAGGLTDKRDKVDAFAVGQVIKLVAESLASYIYGHQGSPVEVFAPGSSLAVSESYISHWLELLSRTPRVAAFLSRTDPLVEALKKELSNHASEVSVQNELWDSTFVFYDVPKAELSIYQVASVALDFVVLVAVLAYLFILFVVLVVATKSFDDLIVVFRRPPSKKVKAT